MTPSSSPIARANEIIIYMDGTFFAVDGVPLEPPIFLYNCEIYLPDDDCIWFSKAYLGSELVHCSFCCLSFEEFISVLTLEVHDDYS